MSLDDDLAPWVAEALDRGEDPAKDPRAKQDHVITALVDLMSTHDRDHSDHFWRCVAGRLQAFAPRVCALLTDGPPELHRDLKHEWTPEVDDLTWWQEHVHHLKREYEDACAILARVQTARHIDRYTPDDVAADEDDRVASVAHFDEAASANGPDLGTVA